MRNYQIKKHQEESGGRTAVGISLWNRLEGSVGRLDRWQPRASRRQCGLEDLIATYDSGNLGKVQTPPLPQEAAGQLTPTGFSWDGALLRNNSSCDWGSCNSTTKLGNVRISPCVHVSPPASCHIFVV